MTSNSKELIELEARVEAAMRTFDSLPRDEQSAFLALFAGARGQLQSLRAPDGVEWPVSFGKAECEWVPFRPTWQEKFPGLGWTTFKEDEPKPALGAVEGSTYTTIRIGVTELGAAVREAYWNRFDAALQARATQSPVDEGGR